jgi:hypothetical protein
VCQKAKEIPNTASFHFLSFLEGVSLVTLDSNKKINGFGKDGPDCAKGKGCFAVSLIPTFLAQELDQNCSKQV